MTPLIPAALLPVLLSASLPAATVLLSNGDFSTGTNPAADGWTRVDGAGTNASPSNYAESVPGSSWGRSMQIKSDGGNHVQQTLTLSDEGAMDATSFSSFTVSFDYGYRRDAVTNGDHTIRVSLWNLTTNQELAGSDLVIANPGVGANFLTGTSLALGFDNGAQTSGDAIAIRFTSLGGDLGSSSWQRTAMIDNVAITAVPEPAAAMLGAFGVLGLLRRRRR